MGERDTLRFVLHKVFQPLVLSKNGKAQASREFQVNTSPVPARCTVNSGAPYMSPLMNQPQNM